MRIVNLILFLVCLTMWPIPGSAEFFRYYDENGVLRFTDNIADVPEDQRSKIKLYDEERDYLTPEQQAAKARAEIEQDNQNVHERKTGAIQRAEIESPGDLIRVREELDRDSEDLQKRQEALQAERDTLTSAEEVRAYQEKIRALNRDIDRFETRRQEFIKKAEQFNVRLK